MTDLNKNDVAHQLALRLATCAKELGELRALLDDLAKSQRDFRCGGPILAQEPAAFDQVFVGEGADDVCRGLMAIAGRLDRAIGWKID